jgi:lysophosphatidate acyltransferase
MSIFSLCIIGLISIITIIYILAKYVLNEKQVYKLKYALYASVIMFYSIILIPVFLVRPRNALNIRLAAMSMSSVLDLFGIKYRIENAKVLDKEGPCVIVANHQSSIDLFGMVKLWPNHVRYCTILAKKELLRAVPLGSSAWLCGLTFVDRKNRERSSETMRQLTEKVRDKSLRLWVFPEGSYSENSKTFNIFSLIRNTKYE